MMTTLVVSAAAAWATVGLIWMVQVVHYPLFAGVGARQFPAYERAHVALTGPVVGPAMVLEAATALALVVAPMASVPRLLPWLGAGLLIVVWISPGLLQVPRHRDLSAGFEATAHRRLVTTNWIRTVAWSLRGLLVLGMVAHAWGTGPT